MKILRTLPDQALSTTPCIITIGNFDGLHLGHQHLIKELTKVAKNQQRPSVVFSFENHPGEILRPDRPICKLCTNDYKIQFLEKLGIDTLILLPFTKQLSELSAEEFILKLQQSISFSHLILGWDATLGKNRQGNKEIIQDIAAKQHFEVKYLNQLTIDNIPVSSSLIREYIQKGNLDQANKLLGRPFSVYSTVLKGNGRGKQLGFPTANIDVNGLCLPPLGVYAVTVILDNTPYRAVANLGVAPTVRQDASPTLEVHILDFDKNLYDLKIEVQFSTYIRPEKKFSSLEELKQQIKKDINQVIVL